MYTEESTVVFTTPERCDLFRAVLGDGADFRINPFESLPLDLTLENVRIGGGRLIVIDEDHFTSSEELSSDLCAYLDGPDSSKGRLRMVIVSSERQAGDRWLAFIAGYLGIYDIVYGCTGAELVNRLASLVNTPNSRRDVLDLLAVWREETQSNPEPLVSVSGSEHELALDTCNIRLRIEVLKGQ